MYRNVQIHDAVSGLKAVERKEELQREIKHQVMLGGTGLDEHDTKTTHITRMATLIQLGSNVTSPALRLQTPIKSIPF